MARRGDRGGALPVIRTAVDTVLKAGLVNHHILVTRLLVDALLDCGTEEDIREADAAINRLSTAPDNGTWVIRDLVLLWARALIANARGDETTYRDYRDRYRAMANELGLEGHMAWAEAMA
jgi:hypothetical protein